MIKLFSLLISMVILLVMSPFSSGDKNPVSVKAEIPSFVKPGDEFEVKLNVKTHGIGGFARLQQYLPAGFTAEAVETEGADFIFDEEGARFIWTNIPAFAEFTVSYRVHVNSSISGRKIINGVFIYLSDEKTEKLALKPLEIVAGSELSASIPVIQRKLSSISPEAGTYRVSLTIQPNNQRSSAKFIDEIPEGFTAEAEQNFNSTFEFKAGQAIFTWAQFPSDSSFTISYIVKSSKPSSPPEIEGVLVYGEEQEDNSALAALNSPKPKQPDPKIEQTVEAIKDAMIANSNENNSAVNTYAAVNEYAKASADASKGTPVPVMTSQGLMYRVQICATRKSPARDSKYFENKYSVPPPVDLSYQEGWRKYMIGSFSSYSEAKAFSQETKKTVTDAFIVAYDNGVRIPVQEANKRSGINQ